MVPPCISTSDLQMASPAQPAELAGDRGVALLERIEEPPHLRRLDADAVVVHFYDHGADVALRLGISGQKSSDGRGEQSTPGTGSRILFRPSSVLRCCPLGRELDGVRRRFQKTCPAGLIAAQITRGVVHIQREVQPLA